MPSLPKPRLRRTARGSLASPPREPERKPRVEVIDGGPSRRRGSGEEPASSFRWVNIERPGQLETGWLEEHFDFHPLDLEDVLSRNQRPKIDEYPDYLFIVLHFPVFDRSVGRLNAGELDLFVGRDFIVTSPNTPLQPVEYLFERCRQKEELREQLFSKGSGFLLYRIVDDGFDYCFPMLRKIGNKLDAVEDEIFEGAAEEVVRDISNVKQEIINFRKVIRPQRAVLSDLENVKQRFLAPSEGEELEIYFEDIGDAHERIWDMLENYKEVVEALEDTNESVISHRVNEILRVLTSISVIVLPLTLVASVWGMNVGVPGEGDSEDFYAVAAAMVVLLIGMLAFFKRRGWL
jgi:magnesium transporter